MLEFLNRFPPPVRIGILAGVPMLLIILTLVIGIAIGGSGKKPTVEDLVNKNDVVLYRRMSQQSAGEAGAKLVEERIPFKLVEEGTAISVPKDRSDRARVALAAAGLPKDGDPGFSLFDKTDFISTDFEKKVKLLRAMNGEIKRLVKQVDGVEDAAAMVTMPEDSLFQTEKRPVTAAVMIKLQPKRLMSPNQVEGLTHLIASAVPGLTTDNVTITDDLGNLLSAGMEANAGNKEDRAVNRLLTMQMTLQRQKEAELESRITTLLDKVLGQGKSVVRASVELDFNKRVQRNVLKAPVTTGNGEAVPLAKSEQTETTSGDGDGGAPGVSSNVPTYPAIPSSSGTGNRQLTKRNLKEQPAFNEQTELIQPSSGNIKRLSIAVLIPYDTPQDQLDSLRDAVVAASGADNARRDQISVQKVKFDVSDWDKLKAKLEEQKKVEEKKNKGKAMSWALVWWIGGGVLLLFLLLAVLRRATRKEANPMDTLTASLGGEEALPAFDQQALGGFDQGAFPGLEGGGFQAPGVDQFGGFPQPGFEQAGFGTPPGYADQPPAAAAPGGGQFDFLYNAGPDSVAQALEGERPATVAGVLGSLDPSYAEQVLQYLDPSIQEEVFTRINQGANLPAMTARMAVQNLKRKLGAAV